MRRLSNLVTAGVLVWLVATSLANGQDSPAWKYAITDLGTLPGDSFAEGMGVNVLGHVAGCSGSIDWACLDSSAPSHAFFWTGRQGMQLLKPFRGGTVDYANGINDSDWVAGVSSGAAFKAHAAVWTDDGRIRDLGVLDKTCEKSCSSYATAITDNGLVVGCSDVPPPPYDSSHAFLWTDDDGMLDLGTLGFGSSCATAVNLQAGVAGWLNTLATSTHAFLWTRREGMRDLGTLKGGENWSFAAGINVFNQVVGQSAYAGGDFHYFHAFLWTKDKGMEDLGVLGKGPDSSEAMAINDAGQLVGWSGSHAFIWSCDKGMRDLNDLIDRNSGWVLNSANAIDILGQITGFGTINGQTHAFLLTLR